MNSENIKTTDPHRLLPDLKDKINLKKSDKYFALSNLTPYYTWTNIKMSRKNIKFKISVPTWNEKFELPDRSYSVSDIQDYSEYIIKKYETVTDNPSIRMYINKIENRITFKIKTENYLELLKPETINLLGSTINKITKDENGENAPHLEIKVVLIHCNIVNNDYQQDSRVLYTIVPNKSFGQLLDISPKSFTILKTFNSDFSYIGVWFTDQISKPLEIEDKISITLVIY